MMLILVAALGIGAADPVCDTAARCNRLGSEAYRDGRLELAAELFDRQIDFAETAMEGDAEAHDGESLQAARDLALNNAALARLHAGQCLQARAYLDLARADARATVANRRQLQARCDEALQRESSTGVYWQYAGHGLWNRVQVAPTGDETVRLDAFWMRVGVGPMDQYGVKAFGELEQVALHPATDGALRGRFEGLDGEATCAVQVRLLGQALDIEISHDANCHIGGAGAVLHGRYQLVSDEIADVED